MVKNPPHGARDTGLIPWPGQSLRASEQLSRRAAAPEAHSLRARALRREEPLWESRQPRGAPVLHNKRMPAWGRRGPPRPKTKNTSLKNKEGRPDGQETREHMLSIFSYQKYANQNGEISLTPVRMAIIKRPQITRVGEDVEEREPLYAMHRNVN